MLILRVGGDEKKIESLKKAKKYDVPKYNFVIEGEQINNISQYFGIDMFSEKKIVRLEEWNREDERKVLYKYLDEIKESKNVFIIDETEIIEATLGKLAKSADVFIDVRVDKKVTEYTPWKLCDYFENKDKKNLWLEFTRIKNICIKLDTKDKADEPLKIIGALSYRIQNSSMSKYTKEERSKVYFDLISCIDKAHSAESGNKVDIWDEIEMWCLSI
jgi:hypothetical protein